MQLEYELEVDVDDERQGREYHPCSPEKTRREMLVREFIGVITRVAVVVIQLRVDLLSHIKLPLAQKTMAKKTLNHAAVISCVTKGTQK